MLYDLYTNDLQKAEKILKLLDKAYLVDGTESDSCDIYQFLDMNEYQMKRIYLAGTCEGVEIRNSKSGDFIWPSERGLNLEQALDIL